MIQLLQNFEQAAWQFNPVVLLGPGLFFLIAGLFIWLGGLGLARVLMAVLGAAIGALCGFFFLGGTIVSAVVLAAVAAFIGMIFKRIVLSLLAASLVAFIVFSYFGAPDFVSPSKPFDVPTTPGTSEQFSINQSLDQLRAYGGLVGMRFRNFSSQVDVGKWLAAAAAALAILAVGFFFSNFISALCCAAFGTAFIFVGLILLLLFKNAYPITYITIKPGLCLAVFGGMAIFGTLEQLLLCRKKKQKDTEKKKDGKEQGEKTNRLRWLGK